MRQITQKWISGFVILIFTANSDAQVVFQDFNANPGWGTTGSGSNGNSFGYQSSSFAGGAIGEAGGRFTRSGFVRYYGDVALGGTIDLNRSFLANGSFVCTGYNAPDFGSGLVLGFYRTDANGWMGLKFNSGGSGIQWSSSYSLGSGATNGPSISFGDGVIRPWSFDWDPVGGPSGNGRLSVVFDGNLQTLDLTASERGVGLTVDAFGFLNPAASNNSSLYADVDIDNVTYSIASVPEPNSFTFVGAVFAFVSVRRKRRSKKMCQLQ